MIPYNAVWRILFGAQILMFVPYMFFFGLVLRQRHAEQTRPTTTAPRASELTKVGLYRSARAFSLGMSFAFGAAALLVMHERARFGHHHFIELPLTSTTDAPHLTPAAQKVR